MAIEGLLYPRHKRLRPGKPLVSGFPKTQNRMPDLLGLGYQLSPTHLNCSFLMPTSTGAKQKIQFNQTQDSPESSRLYLKNRSLTSSSLAGSDTVKLFACELGKVNETIAREGARIDPSRILNSSLSAVNPNWFN